MSKIQWTSENSLIQEVADEIVYEMSLMGRLSVSRWQMLYSPSDQAAEFDIFRALVERLTKMVELDSYTLYKEHSKKYPIKHIDEVLEKAKSQQKKV